MRLVAYLLLCLCAALVRASHKKYEKKEKSQSSPSEDFDFTGGDRDGNKVKPMDLTEETPKNLPKDSKGTHVSIGWGDRDTEPVPFSEDNILSISYVTPRNTRFGGSENKKGGHEETYDTRGKPNHRTRRSPRVKFNEGLRIYDDYMGGSDYEDPTYLKVLQDSLFDDPFSGSPSDPTSKQEKKTRTIHVSELPLPKNLEVYGLKNRENYCFLSSILQVLYHMPGVYNWVVNHHSNNFLHMGMAMLFARLNPQFNKRSPGAQDLSMDLTHIISAFAKTTKASFETGKTDDVSEFWTFLHRILPQLFNDLFAMGITTWQEIGGVPFQQKYEELDRMIAYVQGPETPIHKLISGTEKIVVHVQKSIAEQEYGLDDTTESKGNVWSRLKGLLGETLSDTKLNILDGVQHTTVNKAKILVIQSVKAEVGRGNKGTTWDYSRQTPYEPIIEVGEEGDQEEYQLVATVNYLPGHFVARLLVSYDDVFQEKVDLEDSSVSRGVEEFSGANESGKGGATKMLIDSEIKGDDHELGSDKHPKKNEPLKEPQRDVDVRRGAWATINDSSVKGTAWDAPYYENESPYFFFYVKTEVLREWCIDPRLKTRRVPDKIAEALQLVQTGHDLYRQVLKRTQRFTPLEELKVRWTPPYEFVPIKEEDTF